MRDLDLLHLAEPEALDIRDRELPDGRELPHMRQTEDGEPLVQPPVADRCIMRCSS